MRAAPPPSGHAAAPPVFRGAGAEHRADTCEPLVAAVRAGAVRLVALARGTYPGRRLPAGVLPQLCSIGFWDARRAQNWGLPEHRNEGIEVTYLEGGRLAFAVDGRAHPLRAGDLTVTRPWQPHRVGNPQVGPGRLHWIILDVGVRQPHQPWNWPPWILLSPRDLRDLTAMLRHNEQPVWPGSAEVGRGFAEIGRLLERRPDPLRAASRLALLVNELFLCLFETLRQRRVSRDRRLASAERSVALVLERIAGARAEPWTLETMAAQAGLKRSRFAHYCRKLTNATPIEYLTRLRVERAAALLRGRPDRSITQIAFDCGFASSQYFATVFRRIEGCSPAAYRRQARAAS